MTSNLQDFFASQAKPAARYAGQLAADFQARLRDEYAAAAAADCIFFHTVTLPDGSVVKGAWNLQGSEPALLGGYKVGNKRILEFLPGSGLLTSHMTREGADVVALDLAPELDGRLSPWVRPSGTGTEKEVSDKLRRGWWFMQDRLGLATPTVYADPEFPPEDLGPFDACVLTAALSRSANPYAVLRAAAALARDAVIVSETLLPPKPGQNQANASDPVMAFAPIAADNGAAAWWQLSPGAVCRMLVSLGFEKLDLQVHTTRDDRLPMFTVLARRA